ncbi:MAG: AarF/ABC1/UbiB kinase family protein [Pseudomonadota bacterium]
MSRPPSAARALPVPAGRLSRLARLGSVASSAMGRAAVGAAMDLGRGTSPDLRRLLITPGNIGKLAEELARMRGAAMKIGQMISMDAGEVLPPELADVMARLRDDAHFMPPAQLKKVLNANWPADWLRSFEHFDVRPIAAASIGQVHKARLKDGRVMAIKVQYPGVARSIDSDVANVGALIRYSGLLPKGFDIAPYLEAAREQLHEETDYRREGRCLAGYAERLRGDERFVAPRYYEDWSSDQVLAMSFEEGRPIEEVASLPEATRNAVAVDLIELFLRELLDWGEMQSDPNFANFRYDPARERIVLLDFGATRAMDRDLALRYRDLVAAGLAGDPAAIGAAASGIGFLSDEVEPRHRDRIVGMIGMVFDAFRAAHEFDFADTELTARMQAEGEALAREDFAPPPVPIDALYVQRKVGGLFLLSSKIGAKAPVAEMLSKWVEQSRAVAA